MTYLMKLWFKSMLFIVQNMAYFISLEDFNIFRCFIKYIFNTLKRSAYHRVVVGEIAGIHSMYIT